MCTQYLMGAMDIMEGVAKATRQPFNGVANGRQVRQAFGECRNTPVSGAQLRQMFLNWAEAHPDAWQTPRGLTVWTFLQSKWPCPD